MSNAYNPHTPPRNGKPPIQDTDAPKFIKLAAGLRHGVPTDLRPADCGAAWCELAEGLTLAASTRGPAGVDDALTALERDHPNIVKAIKTAPRPRKTHYTDAELLTAEFPPPVVVIPGLVNEGLNLLGGRPKLGKSWLALQMVQSVASGGMMFGHRIMQGHVIYLALEDSDRRLQKRMKSQSYQATGKAEIDIVWPTLADGGLVQLREAIERTNARLVIIDTLSKFLGGKIDQMSVGEVTDALGELQQMALIYQVAMLVLDHHRKPYTAERDPVADLLGSTAKGGIADNIMGLYRERGQPEATLMSVGRDEEDADLAIKFDKLTMCWQYVGKASEVENDSVKGQVLAILRDEYEGKSTIQELARRLGKKESNIAAVLAELVTECKVKKGKKEGRTVPYLLIGKS